MKRFNTIFVKLFLIFLSIMFFSYLLSSVISATLFKSNLRFNVKRSMDGMQQDVIQHIRQASVEGWNREILISSLKLSLGMDRSYYLFDHQGQLLYSVEKRRRPPYTIDEQVVQRALQGEHVAEEINREGRKWLVTASSIPSANHMEERVIVTLSLGFERDVNIFIRQSIFSVLITISIAAIVFFFFSRWMTLPLKEMNAIAMQFAKGRFNHKVRPRSQDEIGQLGRTLNYMADELASIEDMRKQFLANVSHDLRSPVTSINGFLTALLDGTIPPDREQHYLLMIRGSTDNLMKLVEDLLDMARLEAGQMNVVLVPFNLTEMIRKVIARMEPQFSKNHIGIRLTGTEEECYVQADPDRLDQVMVNLLQNAIHYSPSHTEVEVIITTIESNVQISVKDQGIGLNEDEIHRIWDRFYKGDKARTQKVGTGIGLSIVKHILDLHGSQIEVESKVGHGTTFTFTLNNRG